MKSEIYAWYSDAFRSLNWPFFFSPPILFHDNVQTACLLQPCSFYMLLPWKNRFYGLTSFLKPNGGKNIIFWFSWWFLGFFDHFFNFFRYKFIDFVFFWFKVFNAIFMSFLTYFILILPVKHRWAHQWLLFLKNSFLYLFSLIQKTLALPGQDIAAQEGNYTRL